MKNNTLFVVHQNFNYDGGEVKGVFSDIKLAVKCVVEELIPKESTLYKRTKYGWESPGSLITIEDFVLDKTPEKIEECNKFIKCLKPILQ